MLNVMDKKIYFAREGVFLAQISQINRFFFKQKQEKLSLQYESSFRPPKMPGMYFSL